MDDVKRLSYAVDSITPRYYLLGELFQDVHISILEGETRPTVSFPIENQDAAAVLAPLITAATDCPCEDSGTLKHSSTEDSKAKYLTTKQFTTSFDPDQAGVLSHIHGVLLPEADTIEARLERLNIYLEGGKFKLREQNPKGSSVFATLIVLLPALFYGGEIELRHQGKTEEKDIGEPLRTQNTLIGKSLAEMQYTPPNKLIWFSFYGDVDHIVLPVSYGYRLSLTLVHCLQSPPRSLLYLQIYAISH